MATITLSERSSSGYYVNLGNDTNDTSIAQTCLVYAKLTGAGGNNSGYVFGRTPSSSTNGHRFYILHNSGSPRTAFGGSCSGGGLNTSRPYREGENNSATLNSWGHYAAIWNGTNQQTGITLYAGIGVDLAEVGYSGPGANSGGTPISSVGNPLYLFNRQGLDSHYAGDIAYIARWNRVLTLTELRQAQNDGPLSVPDGLILCWANGQDYGPSAYTPVARATLVEGELPPNTALGGEQGLQASVSASASAAGDLTTGIALAASASASASISGTLNYIIALAGDLSASAAASAALTTQIALTGALAASASTTAALQTGSALAGSLSATAAASGDLTTAIRFAADAISSTVVAGALTTEIRFVATAPASATASADLTTGIALAGAAACSATMSGQLAGDILLSGDLAASATASGDLTTEIRLSASVVVNALAEASLTAGATLAGALSASAAASGDLTTAIRFAAAVSVSAGTTADLTTAIPLFAAITATADASGMITLPLRLSADVVAQAVSTGALTTRITMAADVAASAVMSGELLEVNQFRMGRVVTAPAGRSIAIANILSGD